MNINDTRVAETAKLLEEAFGNEKDAVTMTLHEFKSKWAAFFFSEHDPKEGPKLTLWLDRITELSTGVRPEEVADASQTSPDRSYLPGVIYLMVDVVDEKGEIVFTVPPFAMNRHNGGKFNGRITDIVNEINLADSSGRPDLAAKLTQGITYNSRKEIPDEDMAKVWEDIYIKCYGPRQPEQNTPDATGAPEGLDDDFETI